MTIKEAIKRKDYRFWVNTVEYFKDELIEGKFESWDKWDEENGVFNKGIAYLELGWVDIELNIVSGCAEDGCSYINEVVPSYFICVKGKPTPGTTDWSSAGYLDDFGYTVYVDWEADNWIELLEKDMLKKLLAAVKEFDLNIDEPNWIGSENVFEVFDRIHGIRR